MKRIYACGDVHDDVEALQGFARYVATQGADHILFNGDFSLRPYMPAQLQALVQSRDVSAFIAAKRATNGKLLAELKRILTSTSVPFSVVPGNYDPSLEGIFETELHRKTSRIGEAKVFGYGGADAGPAHIDLLVRLGEIIPFDHRQLYDDLQREQPAIALVHNPPAGLCDDMFNGENVGTPATTKYIIERGLAKLVVSGHIHEAGPLGANPHGVRGLSGYQH
ncbi:metallophosphoesterase family protein [Candidatus Woesearchaeota archaeon]|nr:metallophosphoesterase family protein [Candidatus Woesearchaeota archaeon]